MNEHNMPVLGVDLGGTKILAAAVDPTGRVIARIKRKTRAERGPEAVITRLIETCRRVIRKAGLTWDEIGGVGLGAPGPLDPTHGIIYNTPNMPGWNQVPLGPRLAEALGVPVYLENDVNLGTLGEHALGAGRGTQDMVGIFVGTGVGGGVILDGKLRSGVRSAAGEIGHMVVLAEGPVCGCGKRGCLESVASRTAIVRDIRSGIAAGRESIIPQMTGGDPERLTSGVLARAWRQRDPLVREVMGRAQFYLGVGVASIVNLLDPEMIVFGGGVVEALGDEFLAQIRIVARQYFIQQRDADRVRIVTASLGDQAGVLGAAVLVWQRSHR